jgi:hypothetical protein
MKENMNNQDLTPFGLGQMGLKSNQKNFDHEIPG